jgi:molybdopterin adenylyltransferase
MKSCRLLLLGPGPDEQVSLFNLIKRLTMTSPIASLKVPCQGGDASSLGDAAKFGIVVSHSLLFTSYLVDTLMMQTVSDRASTGVYEDLSGPAILSFFSEAIESPWSVEYRLVPDEQHLIEQALVNLVDVEECCLVVTTGGTGPAPRDVTPEATEAVCQRMMPGYGEQMRAISLKYVPTAVLSRQTAGIRGKALIINLPGKPKSIRETFDEVFKSIPYCIQLLGGPYLETKGQVVEAFRPPNEKRVKK